MKAITLWRPWDQAILRGAKLVENRPWPLPRQHFFSLIALHAGKRFDYDAYHFAKIKGLADEELLQKLMDDNAPSGIVGAIKVDGVYHESFPGAEDLLGPWFFGPYGWHISEVYTLEEPISCRGSQRLWNLPAGIEAELRRRLDGQSPIIAV